MAVASRPIVRTRLVVQIHGYQLTGPERFFQRFVRDLSTFGTTWSVETGIGTPRIGLWQAQWSAEARAGDWQTHTDYRLIRLDDVIAARHARPLFTRFRQGILGLLDFVFDRAILGYFRFGWRYALFTLAPLAMIVGAVLAGVGAGHVLASRIGIALGAIGGLAAFAGLIALAGWRGHLFTLLEDWAFASILVRRLEPAIASRLEESAREVKADIASGRYDEVLLIGHSLGAALILHLAESLMSESQVDTNTAGSPNPRLAILTIGSSVLKIALHSKAAGIRRATQAVTNSPRVVWGEYHAPQDIMNFPRVDPAEAMGIAARHPPIFRKAVFRQALDAEGFKRMNANYFLRHNQFYKAGTRRSAYEYFLFVCGPFFAADLLHNKDGAMNWLDESGAITARAPGAEAPDKPPIA